MTEVDFQTSKIVNGSNLMLNNKDLTTWNSPLTNLENGHQMFKGCTKLVNVLGCNESGYEDFLLVEKLTDASYMFENCIFDTINLGSLYRKLTNAEGMFKNCHYLGPVNHLYKGANFYENVTNAKEMFYNAGKNYDLMIGYDGLQIMSNFSNVVDATQMCASDVNNVEEFPLLEMYCYLYNAQKLTNVMDRRILLSDYMPYSFLNNVGVPSGTTQFIGRLYQPVIFSYGTYFDLGGFSKMTNSTIPVDTDIIYNNSKITFTDYYCTTKGGATLTARCYHPIPIDEPPI